MPMIPMDFQGRDTLLAMIGAAIAGNDDAAELVAHLSHALGALLHGSELRLPAQVFTPVTGHYARRLLHADGALGYSVIAMTWAPGQVSSLHDHDGQWCVEGIVQGTLEITEFDWVERAPDARGTELHRFTPHTPRLVGIGSTSGLYPPREFHVARNPSTEATTVSLHVYQRRMNRCHVFEPLPERPDWYRRALRELATD